MAKSSTWIEIAQRWKAVLFRSLLLCIAINATAGGTLPEWTVAGKGGDDFLWLDIPAQMDAPLPKATLKFLVLRMDRNWDPDWKRASFDMKNLIVSLKTAGPDVRVGLEGSEAQVKALMSHELAPYVEGYVFSDNPFIPDSDPTGKLWQKAGVPEDQVLRTLVEAGSIGIELVIFQNPEITESHREFLDVVKNTPTGGLDLQPEIFNLPQETAQFFFNTQTGNYHLAVYAPPGESLFHFSLSDDMNVTLVYPETARYRHDQFGKRTEIKLLGDAAYYFFLLEPSQRAGATESLEITERETIDPYELVVKNQVFKDSEDQKFQSLEVEELQNYNYTTPGGISIDVTFKDLVVIRKDRPIERIRKELYIGNVKWRSEKLPELPLIQPEKVQSVPLEIDLDKSYGYTYLGDGTLDGHPVWRVRFQPKEDGDFFSGTVWIDKETGAHRKIQAIQSGLEAPVIGNEVTAFFDWVEYGGQRFWTQVREENLQIINVAGLRLALQINSRRSDFNFNRPELERVIEEAYQSNLTILRDTAKGFRYLVKKGGERVVSDDTVSAKKALLGGVFFDPARDSPVPLGGFNYTNLDFLNKGWQANFFLAGALNDLIVSDPDFLDRGWDFTAELFLTAVRFSDRIFQGGEEREELEIEELRESVNLTLGIPLNSFFKLGANYSLRYLDYARADNTAEEFVIPSQTFENIGRLTLEYSRKRFNSSLDYEFVKRTDWERFGLPGDTEPLRDSYSSITFDAGVNKRLPKFQTVEAGVRYLKGWDLDRFSRFGFGFFENRVPGFGSSGVEADEAVRLQLEYEIGFEGIFNIDLELAGARSWRDGYDAGGMRFREEPVDLAGLGLAVNFIGPWKTLIRLDMGYGIHSDLPGEDGELSGQLVFLRLF